MCDYPPDFQYGGQNLHSIEGMAREPRYVPRGGGPPGGNTGPPGPQRSCRASFARHIGKNVFFGVFWGILGIFTT